MDYALTFLLGFLLGSIPSGYLVGRAKGVDIRQHGSGNIGSTNVLRTLGKGPGYLVFACDALKGVAAVLLANRVFPSLGDLGGITAAIGCILGHNFTPWLGFKGGKGIATSLGVLIGLLPLASVIALAIWIGLFLITRYVSLASIIAAAVLPVIVWLVSGVGTLFWFSLLIGILAIARHRTNIVRLINGTESRFSREKEDAP
jgi:glycerol-3-phosphate acyltransferase PlsY